MIPASKICKICGREFTNPHRKCCSAACSKVNAKNLKAVAYRKKMQDYKTWKRGPERKSSDIWARHRKWREEQMRAEPERFAMAISPDII